MRSQRPITGASLVVMLLVVLDASAQSPNTPVGEAVLQAPGATTTGSTVTPSASVPDSDPRDHSLARATCWDDLVNGGETDVDCGGVTSCPRCRNGMTCDSSADCKWGPCVERACTEPTVAPLGAADPASASAATRQRFVPSLSSPRRLEYRGRADQPEGYVYRERARTGLLISGSVVFGLGYLAAISWHGKAPESGVLVPVVGPFIAAAHKPCTPLEQGGERCPPLVLLGIAQTVGAGLLTAAFAFPSKYYVREDLASVELAPWVGRSTTGIAARGRF